MSNLLSQASLVMIPSGYKEDVVYSVIPDNGNGDLSFTRASNGTRVNSAGLVEDVPWNIVEYSEDFANAYWSLSGGSITSNSTTAPNGTATADTFTRTSGTAYLYNGSFALTIGQFTQSVYAKANASSLITINFVTNAFARGAACIFDLSNGTAGAITIYGGVSGFTASIENVGNGWYRCSLGGTITIADTYFWEIEITTGSIFVWGAQLNIGATAKPYFPTTDRLNVPRLTYQNGGGGCPSLLLEKQSTNLISYSNADASMAFNGTLTLNNTTSPEGVSNAFSFLVNANANGGLAIQTITTSAQSYTFSAYLKGSVNGQKVRLFGDLNSTIEDFTLTTDWVRYTKTFTGAVGGQSIYLLNGAYMSPVQNNLYYGYGMQIEVSSYATSLIPSNGSSATRVADLGSTDTIQTAQTFAGDFTIFADFVPFIDSTDAFGLMILGGGNQALGATYKSYLFFTGPNLYLTGDAETIIIQKSYSMVVNQRVKVAVTRVGSTVKMFIDGAQVGASATSSLSITIRSLGWSYVVGQYRTQGKINQILLSASGASDTDAISLTTI